MHGMTANAFMSASLSRRSASCRSPSAARMHAHSCCRPVRREHSWRRASSTYPPILPAGAGRRPTRLCLSRLDAGARRAVSALTAEMVAAARLRRPHALRRPHPAHGVRRPPALVLLCRALCRARRHQRIERDRSPGVLVRQALAHSPAPCGEGASGEAFGRTPSSTAGSPHLAVFGGYPLPTRGRGCARCICSGAMAVIEPFVYQALPQRIIFGAAADGPRRRTRCAALGCSPGAGPFHANEQREARSGWPACSASSPPASSRAPSCTRRSR